MSNQHDFLASNRTLSQVVAFGYFVLEQVEFSWIFVGRSKVLILWHFERRPSEQIKRGAYVGKFTSIYSLEGKRHGS